MILSQLLSITSITVRYLWADTRESRFTMFLSPPGLHIDFRDAALPRDPNGLTAVKYQDLETRQGDELNQDRSILYPRKSD